MACVQIKLVYYVSECSPTIHTFSIHVVPKQDQMLSLFDHAHHIKHIDRFCINNQLTTIYL